MRAIFKWADLALFFGFGVFIAVRMTWTPLHILGLLIGAAGFSLWLLARVQLGRCFAVSAQAKGLVTTGLYCRIRHPVYFFAGVGYAGLLFAFDPRWLPFVFFYAAGQYARVRREEAALEQAFGDQYRRYKSHTWF